MTDDKAEVLREELKCVLTLILVTMRTDQDGMRRASAMLAGWATALATAGGLSQPAEFVAEMARRSL